MEALEQANHVTVPPFDGGVGRSSECFHDDTAVWLTGTATTA